ncbi:MAG: serine/threonine-protein kinase [Myxococcaceae bacterium]
MPATSPTTDPRAAALALDLSGQKVGEYQLIRRVGVGGMGAVFEGMQPLIGKRVAVKFLLPTLSQDASLVERFLSEARAVNAIGHRGIVDIFSFGVHDQMQYFVMEFLEGRPFDRVIREQSPMQPGQAVRYLEELLDALGAAHAKGVIHRDIKPSNVFLVEKQGVKPYVKLLDFGIAKVNATQDGQTPQTRQSVVIGTPEYIAPEQAQGLSIGPQTDLYAVGCMAYEMLTGVLPFKGSNPLETMFKHVTEATPRARDREPGVPPALDELVYRLMAKQPQDRPRSVEEVSQLLIRALGSATAPLPATPPPSAPPRPMAVPDRAGPSAFAQTFVRTGDLEPIRTSTLTPLPPKRRWIVPVSLALVAIAAGLTVWAVTRGPAPEPQKPVVIEPPPTVAPPPVVTPPPQVAVAPAPVPAPAPAPTPAPAPAPAPVPKVTKRTPGKREVTAEQLQAKITQVESRLEEKEAAKGQRIASLHNVLNLYKGQATSAKSADERAEVAAGLDELGKQIAGK